MTQDYGLWPLVVLDSAVMIVFAASFFHPKGKRDWRAMGGYSALCVPKTPSALMEQVSAGRRARS